MSFVESSLKISSDSDRFFHSLSLPSLSQHYSSLAGEVFNIESTRPWEFNATAPLRSASLPLIYLKVPMTVLKFICLYAKMFFNIDLMSSYVLLVFPRAIMCLISFVNDYSVWKICKCNNIKHDIRLFALASSWVVLTFGTRCFSNSLEMALCSMILCYVSECMVLSNTVIYQREFLEEKYERAERVVDKVKFYKMMMSLPRHNFKRCFPLATLCVIGMFNRPTFLFFGLPIIFHWMIRGFGSKTVTFADFNLRMLYFIVSGLPALAVIILIDSFYYGYLSLAQIYIFDVGIDNFLVTPVNFIRYNINPDNTASHGEHPKWLHMLVNIPLLFNVLGCIGVGSFGMMIYRFGKKEFQNLPQTQSFVSLMTSAAFVPVLLLSLFNHQEARFLIPITVPLLLLYAAKLILGVSVENTMRESQWSAVRSLSSFIPATISGKFILRAWYTFNVAFTLFYGFIHQAGVVQVASHFSKYHPTTSAQIHLVTSHLYMLPPSLLLTPSTEALFIDEKSGQKFRKNKRIVLHELGSLNMTETVKRVKRLIDVAEVRARTSITNYELFLALPSTRSEEFSSLFRHSYNYIEISEENSFYPHVSVEAFPDLMQLLQESCGMENVEETEQKCSEQSQHYTMLSVSSVVDKLKIIMKQFRVILYRLEVKHLSQQSF